MNKHHPFHPIIYVRGFAATQGEIEDAVADPYMGFNVGSTKARTAWTGDIKRFFFESPLVRLMSDNDLKYDDVFVAGEDLLTLETSDQALNYRCIIIYRYYDEASEAFGTGETPPITHFGRGLNELILRLRTKVCENSHNEVTPDEFRCYLVAHSMGGLVCRAFLHGKDETGQLGTDEARRCVDKLFTYATPHNGIDMRIVRNVPAWATFGDVRNFNRDVMSRYLDVPAGDDVSVVHKFPPKRVFNLIGTNPSDYRVMGGLSAWAAGEASDGLVRIVDATTHGPVDEAGVAVSSPRAFVHRSHSGHYGIVNSEEGYQNLTRFLFGGLRVDGTLDVDDITLPLEVEEALSTEKTVRASYQFEIVVSVRGCHWQMHRRTVRENSAIFRRYQDLFRKEGEKRVPNRAQSPHLFSVFLDPRKSVKESGSVSFGFDLRVIVPDYEVNGIFFLKRHYEGSYIYRELILVEAIPDKQAEVGWRIKFGYQDTNPGRPGKTADTRPLENETGLTFDIPIEQKRRPGLIGKTAHRSPPLVITCSSSAAKIGSF